MWNAIRTRIRQLVAAPPQLANPEPVSNGGIRQPPDQIGDDNGEPGTIHLVTHKGTVGEGLCPCCKIPYNTNGGRDIAEECGHSMCRSCVIQEVGCLTCSNLDGAAAVEPVGLQSPSPPQTPSNIESGEETQNGGGSSSSTAMSGAKEPVGLPSPSTPQPSSASGSGEENQNVGGSSSSTMSQNFEHETPRQRSTSKRQRQASPATSPVKRPRLRKSLRLFKRIQAVRARGEPSVESRSPPQTPRKIGQREKNPNGSGPSTMTQRINHETPRRSSNSKLERKSSPAAGPVKQPGLRKSPRLLQRTQAIRAQTLATGAASNQRRTRRSQRIRNARALLARGIVRERLCSFCSRGYIPGIGGRKRKRTPTRCGFCNRKE